MEKCQKFQFEKNLKIEKCQEYDTYALIMTPTLFWDRDHATNHHNGFTKDKMIHNGGLTRLKSVLTKRKVQNA